MTGKIIKVIQIDNGGEFMGLHPFLRQNGILHLWPYPYAHHQMGAVVGEIVVAKGMIPKRMWKINVI